ncbi:hypothetical protein P691DRAFT_837584 [Macrolepiota fuliginosa MF-IS2]|uniref:Uncharacterized protein n=1 Tax=Macrolepiota fuliginosa MF-IS2 TaxID=1400762 RepID=A0A9P6C0G8_9AGAR|nr:hypothetical protein P691DRAFT_837584 [Macrolepiota fuliginosa MF-IS2]
MTLLEHPDPEGGSSGRNKGYGRSEAMRDAGRRLFHRCGWPKFSIYNITGEINIPGVADNKNWTLDISPANFYPSQLGNTGFPPALSAFLFASESWGMDLTSTDAPVTFGLFQTLGSVLLCHPQPTIQRARVVLSNGTLDATIIPNSSLVGNVLERAANTIFAQALLSAFGPESADGSQYGELAGVVLLQGHTNLTDSTLRPLPLSDINRNISLAFQSSAKAYISGYRVYNDVDLGFVHNYVWHNSTASIWYQQDSLVTSKPTLIAVGVLDVIIVIIMAILVFSVNIADMELFSLRALEGIYHKESSAQID